MLNHLLALAMVLVGIVSNVLPYLFISCQLDDEFQKKIYLFWSLVLALIIGSISNGFYSTIFSIFYFIVFYFILKKKRASSLFFALYISLTYETFRYFLNSITFRVFNVTDLNLFSAQIYFMTLCLLIILLNNLMFRYIRLDFPLLETDEFAKVLRNSNLVFGTLFLFKTIVSILGFFKVSFEAQFDTTLSLLILVGYVGTLLYIKSEQERYFARKDMEEKKSEIRNLNQYVDKLGHLYDEIRGFRHDFAGIVSSLGPAIQERDLAGIEKIYDKALVKTNLELQKEDYRFFDLKNVEDLAVRGALANHILKAEREHIDLRLEITNTIPTLEVSMLEVIRMTNIILNNALEAARETPIRWWMWP
ncbi:hypothetical protein [Streptococcus oricebi]|uniref:Histidine kinase n=1 Tax=Streptococcus oricebi TaxID=1547447 RepID=A0ABS5B5R2_9STRE|nr:hypothetical protein [Streptococcus oricebi]MBP2624149.1 hypothetical protein [Streptococcus oricebi]